MSIEYDPNAGDLKAVGEELAFAERLGDKWKSRIVMVPLHGYGVEWAVIDPESEELKALLFFEHGQRWPEDRPYTVRASRVANGGVMALRLGVPLISVILRGKEGTRYASFSDAKQLAAVAANRWAVREVREGAYEQWLAVDEDSLKQFKG
jgi:hypothetical protein